MLISTFSYSQNGLDSLIIETYYISDVNDTSVNVDGGTLPIGSVTYRIYADMQPGYRFQALYGVPTHTLSISTTTTFFNNIDRGATSPTYTKTQARDHTVMLDSWFSVGAACTGNFGVLKSEDDGVSTVVNNDGVLTNSVSAIGIPLTQEDGLIAGSPETVTFVGLSNELDVFGDGSIVGNLFMTDNGSIASLNGSRGADTTVNKVLIAQITTDGQMCYEFNIQIRSSTGVVENYVAKNPVAAEIQLPSLMGCVGGTVPNILPSVSITSPTNGSVFLTGATVPVTATATDADGTVDSVEFYVNTTKIGSDLSSPYQVNWMCSTGSYSLTAIATDNAGGKDTSAIVTVTVNSGVNINEESASNAIINVYPNPAKDQFTLEVTTAKPSIISYTIYNVNGTAISFQKHGDPGTINGTYRENIDISSLANGQYIVVVSVDWESSVKKFIKN